MRIVSGKWAGKSLVSPGGRVRPTPERLRDAWMERLTDELPGAKVLDLYAGTGAMGLEALSRGAKRVDFVERGGEALHALKANRAKFRVGHKSRLFKKDVFLFLDSLKGADYDLVLADPPYTSQAAEGLVKRWVELPFSRVLSIEHPRELMLPGKCSRLVWEDTAVTFYRSEVERSPSDQRTSRSTNTDA